MSIAGNTRPEHSGLTNGDVNPNLIGRITKNLQDEIDAGEMTPERKEYLEKFIAASIKKVDKLYAVAADESDPRHQRAQALLARAGKDGESLDIKYR